MRKTILKEFLIYTTISSIIVSFVVASLISTYKLSYIKKNMLVTAEILSENIGHISENEFSEKFTNVGDLAKVQNLQLDIINENGASVLTGNIIDLPNISSSKSFFKQELSVNGKHNLYAYYSIQNSNYILKLSSTSNTLYIYLSTTLFLLFLNLFISYFYTKNIRKNVINPLTNISKNIFFENQNNSYKFEELETLNFNINSLKNSFNKSIHRLKLENKKREYIIDNMSEGFLLIDETLKILTINKTAKKIFNCKENAGKNIFHYTQNIKIINPIENAIKQDKNSNFDIRLKNKKIYSTYINKVKKENLKHSEYIVLMVDVTLERQNQKLKQELFSNISHELKTPITSIKGYAELLQNDFAKTKEEEDEFLTRIEKETHNITQLINDILTISKLQNKQQNLKINSINIYNLVDEISKSLLPMYIEKNITIENNCKDITIKADYKSFYKLFNNLMLNAVKYNRKDGYVKIYFQEQNDYFELIVKDSGVGIPIEDTNRIFERFYRVEKGRNVNNGSGLGLSIVKYIVKLYNGKIKVKSKVGVGSSFYIKFPKNKIK